ncbi:GNAT family N-acetyltransferase [Nocardioides sp.]|uniref:GNAT family N-acetyltransferase n=1 Tax=Nocardioides sp. TaxID=35761 RepID=UPI001A2181BB|nr:GNAT family N-acetyltransferase [Nocardioides sp.]MBJ7358235.1 GNAT family N-acetyltransferase [Nocardioides sp.]
MTLDAADVLARAAEWVWVPPFARELRTPEYRVVAYPDYFSEPTAAMPAAFDSTRDPQDVVDDVLGAAAALDREQVAIMGLGDLTRPEGLEAHLVGRGATRCETLAVLALDLTRAPFDLDAPGDVEVRAVGDLETLRDYDRIGVEVFGGTLRTEEELLTSLESVAEGGRDPMLVAYRGGEPLGTGGLTVAGDVLRLWGGAVLPEARGTGVYRAVLDHRLRAGLARGCRLALVKGRVETSAPILRRAGFAAYGEERGYRVSVP